MQGTKGAQVDRHVGKRALGDETAAEATGEHDVVSGDALRKNNNGVGEVGQVLAVASHAVVITAENRRLLGRLGILRPIPILFEHTVSLLILEQWLYKFIRVFAWDWGLLTGW